MRKSYFNNPTYKKDLNLYFCGYEDCDINFSYGPHVREHYLLHFIVKGSGCLYKDNNKYRAASGDVFIIYPGEVTTYTSDGDNPWSFYWLSFNGRLAKMAVDDMGLSPESPVRQVGFGIDIGKHINRLMNSIKTPTNDIRLAGYLHLAIAALQIGDNQTKINKNESNSYIDNALNFIQFNYFNSISIKQIADYTNLERTYFSKIFKIQMGIPPQDYLLKYRIEKACEFIQGTDLSNKEIGKCVGIVDEYYFSKVFKKVVGMTPSQYRKQKKNLLH